MCIIEMIDMDKKEIDELYLSVSHFNIQYNTTKKYKQVVDVLKQYGGLKEVWCVVTNTARALNQRSGGLTIPKTKECYFNNSQGLSYTKMFRLLDKLVEAGLFVFYRGGLYNMNPDMPLQSVYMFTDKYHALWKGVDVSDEKPTVQAVQVKDRETKEILSNKGRKGVALKERSVLMLNEMLMNTQIFLDDIDVCVQQYTRIFNDNLQAGGRFYNTVGGVQTLPQKRRKTMQINGENVVELDFKAIHPALLYEKARQKAPDVVDYWIEHQWEGEFKPYPTFSPVFSPNDMSDEYTVRRLHKFAMLVGLNAKNIAGAVAGLSQEFFDDKRRAPEDRRYGEISYGMGLRGKPTFPSKKICEHVMLWNKPISEFFFKDVGIILQNVDSDIMALVIEELYGMGEVLLPMHDSIIVRESLADEAETIMRKAYKQLMDTDKFCFIERK